MSENIKKLKVYTEKLRNLENLRGANHADMQLKSKYEEVFDFYYVLLMFLVNMYGLFLRKIKMHYNY